MTDDADKTDPNLQALKDATARADPWADKLLAWATASAWTPWLLLAQAAGWVALGVRLAR